jgi:hypothetical protein
MHAYHCVYAEQQREPVYIIKKSPAHDVLVVTNHSPSNIFAIGKNGARMVNVNNEVNRMRCTIKSLGERMVI